MQPLKITAFLQSPVIGDFSLPFDGILYYQAHRERLGAQMATIPGAELIEGDSAVRLPLKRIRLKGPNGKRLREWMYAASWAQWPREVSNGIDHWNCRFDFQYESLVDFGDRKPRVEIASGAYRSYRMPVFYRHAVSLCWYVVGNRDEIAALLATATNIGKKPAQGWGAISRWAVESHHEDWSTYGPNGELMRAIPAEEGVLAGYRPSYWNPANQRPCKVPRENVALATT